MAAHAPIMGAPTRASFIPAPPAAITRTLARFDRDQLAGFVAVAIDLLDFVDGDPDLDQDGDEQDCASPFLYRADDRPPEYHPVAFAVATEDDEATGAEDDFMEHEPNGPGCPIADPDLSSEDAGNPGEIADRSYAEWHTLAPGRRRAGHVDGKPRDPFLCHSRRGS